MQGLRRFFRVGHRIAAAAAFFAIVGAARSAAAPTPRFPDMTGGRYEVRVDGMLCHTCLRLLVEEVVSLKEVEKASGDFDKETLYVVVRPDATLKSSKLQKALRRASKRADLDTSFQLVAVRYRVK